MSGLPADGLSMTLGRPLVRPPLAGCHVCRLIGASARAKISGVSLLLRRDDRHGRRAHPQRSPAASCLDQREALRFWPFTAANPRSSIIPIMIIEPAANPPASRSPATPRGQRTTAARPQFSSYARSATLPHPYGTRLAPSQCGLSASTSVAAIDQFGRARLRHF